MPKSLRVMTYNIRHGQGQDGRISLERVAMNIVAAGADLCGIQEVDRYMPRSGLRDQARVLANLCNMHYVFGSNLKLPRLVAYGTMVLSRWPIVYSQNYPLPGTGEARGLLKAVILVGRQQLSFFTTHLGLNGAERIEQARLIKKIIGESASPVILTGDFNESIDGRAVEMLVGEGMINCLPAGARQLPTFPSNDPQKQIDYIFVRGPWLVEDVWVVNSQASDHLPLVAVCRNKPHREKNTKNP